MPPIAKADQALQRIQELSEVINRLAIKVDALESVKIDALTIRRLEASVNGVDVVKLSADVTSLSTDVRRILTILDGDPKIDVDGLRSRVEQTEQLLQKMVSERNMIKYFLIGLSLTGITNLGAIITVLSKLGGAIP